MAEIEGPPHYSQWGSMEATVAYLLEGRDPSELRDWRADGYTSAEDYRRWSDNTCGVACLQSLLEWWGIELPLKMGLIEELTQAGAYLQSGQEIKGLIYDPCVAWMAQRWGIPATTHRELSVEGIVQLVSAGNPVMASVSHDIRYRRKTLPHRGGHLVLVHQICNGKLVFENPSGLSAQAASGQGESAHRVEMSPENFRDFFAGRGVSFSSSSRRTGRVRQPDGSGD